MGRPSQKCYVMDIGGALKALVPEHGLFRMCHVSVVMVRCKHCGAPRGEACRGVMGQPTTSTHVVRKDAAGKNKRHVLSMRRR